MTTTHSQTTYRRTYIGLWVLGGLLLGILTAIRRPLVGVGFYLLAVGGALGFWYHFQQKAGTVFDERDDYVHRTASGYTLTVFGYASAIVFPVLTALTAVGQFEWTSGTTAVAVSVAVLYLTYAVFTAVVRSRISR